MTAADIAGTIGDLLAELGVVVIPRLEEISYESPASRGESSRMARVAMAYTFADVDSGERLVAKVAGQGLDPGDKAPYKAMTGALKYALLQSFLLATGDDPEEERPDGRSLAGSSESLINPDEIQTLKRVIDGTGTELERGAGLLQARLAERDERSHLPTRARSAQPQAGTARPPGEALKGPIAKTAPQPNQADRHLCTGFGCFRGLFQYGDLQRGQTRGSWPASRGTHSCSQRSQRNPESLTFAKSPSDGLAIYLSGVAS